MRHLKTPSLFVVLLAAQLSLTSCGGGDGGTRAEASGDQTSTDQTSTDQTSTGQPSAGGQSSGGQTPVAAEPPVGATFTRTYGGAGNDAAGAALQTPDGGYIIAGETASYGAGGSDLFLLKIDANGGVLWSKTFGGAGTDDGNSVEATSDGGYVIAGRTDSSGAGSFDLYLVKTDADGNELWSKAYGGAGSEDGNSVVQTSDGGYIVAGETGSFGAGGYDVYLVKTDADGNELWSRTFGGAGTDDAHSVRQTADGGYVIVGDTWSFGAGGSDAFLIKTDADGNELWSKTLGGAGNDYGHSVRESSDGGYVISGYTGSFGAGGYDVYLVKTDPNGVELWSRTFGGSGSDDGNSVEQTSDGGYIVAGISKSFSDGYDVYLVKTDSNGGALWSKTFGGAGADYGYSVRETADGGYIVAGETSSFGATSKDFFVIKTDSNGNALPY